MSLTLDKNLNGIPYMEAWVGSGKRKYGNGGSAQQTLICNWTDLEEFVDQLRGSSEFAADGSIVTRYPHNHPNLPSFYVDDVSVDPFGQPTGLEDAFQYAKLTVIYKPYPYDEPGGSQINEPGQVVSGEISYRILEIPGYVIESDLPSNNHVMPPMFKIVPEITYSIFTPQSTALPLGNAKNAQGKLNSGSWTIAGVSYPEGTALYLGMSFKSEKDEKGRLRHDLTHKVIASPIDFRHAINPANGNLEKMNVNGQEFYETTSFGFI